MPEKPPVKAPAAALPIAARRPVAPPAALTAGRGAPIQRSAAAKTLPNFPPPAGLPPRSAAPGRRPLVQRMEMPDSPLRRLFTDRGLKDVSDNIVSFLEPRDVVRLDRTSNHGLPNIDQLFRIELGAGPMDSAGALGGSVRRTAFTEFRPQSEIESMYGPRLHGNLAQLPPDFDTFRKNSIVFGVDATNLARAKLPKSLFVRFTNPNIGHQDLEVDTILSTVCYLIHTDGTTFNVAVGDLVLELDVTKIEPRTRDLLKKHYQRIRGGGDLQQSLKGLGLKQIISFVSHTAHNAAACRNIRMLECFLANVGKQLYNPRSGRVEIIVAKRYVDDFNIAGLAACLGFQMRIEKFDLPHEHMQTKENKIAAGGQKGEHCLIILAPGFERQVERLYDHIIADPITNLLTGVRPFLASDAGMLRWDV